MLSTRMVRRIESNWEVIASRLIAAVREHPDLPNLSRKNDLEIREWCRKILENLGRLLQLKKDEEVAQYFQGLGKIRFEENIPLHEAVLRLHILKDKIIGFAHEQGFPMTAMELHAEEELELRVGRFFDASVYHIVRGYENAMRVARRLAS